jgi:hypothetical protein
MHVQEMIASHPAVHGNVNDALIRCIEACYDCAQTCTVCADACLGEAQLQDLLQCIRLNLDCADVCAATGQVASRRTGTDELVIRRMIEVCADACRLCGAECDKHAERHEHCRICAEICHRCEQACRSAAATITPTLQ